MLQIVALMKGKAGLEVRVSQAAVAPLETYHQTDTLPQHGCKACALLLHMYNALHGGLRLW